MYPPYGGFKMLKNVKNLLIVSFIMLCSCLQGEVLEEEELKIEFENIWWEILDFPPLLISSAPLCYFFDSETDNVAGNGGTIYYYDEDTLQIRELSRFERINLGYYVPDYNVILEIFVNQDDQYSVEASMGALSALSDIIPCSLAP